MSELGVVNESLGEVMRLEEVVDRDALAQLCNSVFSLFGLSVRVLSREGKLLADVHQQRSICGYVNSLPRGQTACGATVGQVKRLEPEGEILVHPCFTGAVYRVVPIHYQGRTVGRFVIGPYLPAEVREVPQSLLEVDPSLDAERAREGLTEMPRVRAETAERIALHLRSMVDLLLFSSHRARLTSEMHVASVRESYRELAEKNDALQQAYDQLKELDRLKSNFLATVSHELRTPLTSIIGYSEMLQSGIAGELSGDQKEFVDTIHSKGDHLLALISSLLDLSKLEQGNLPLQPQPLKAAELLDEVITTIKPQAQKKNVAVQLQLEGELEPIQGDPVRVKQVLFNLTENAIKFTPEGGQVQLGARAAEMEPEDGGGGVGFVLMGTPRSAIAFTVRDTGIGIPRAELKNIFDAFYQVDGSSTRQHGGAGLGLSIVRRLVDAHGGRIEVDSTPGEGTSFTVLIPELDGDAAS